MSDIHAFVANGRGLCARCGHAPGTPHLIGRTDERVRIVHASMNSGMVGFIAGPATQAGMDVVVDFGNGNLAEYRRWELEGVCPACDGEGYDPRYPATARPETRCKRCNGSGAA